jgi:Mrp family chromosome partitioning ATPase
MLDTIRLLPRAEYLAVATDSRVVLGMVRKTLQLHRTLRTRVCGIVENMKRRDGQTVAEFARELDMPYLGALPFDESLEAAIGDPEQLAQTPFAAAVGLLSQALAESSESS